MEANLLSSDWTYISPGDNCYAIQSFDDGNQEFSQYNNVWKQFGVWRGKVALYNKDNSNIVIKSISAWKVRPIK